jgi:hypothetical protein
MYGIFEIKASVAGPDPAESVSLYRNQIRSFRRESGSGSSTVENLDYLNYLLEICYNHDSG